MLRDLGAIRGVGQRGLHNPNSAQGADALDLVPQEVGQFMVSPQIVGVVFVERPGEGETHRPMSIPESKRSPPCCDRPTTEELPVADR